MYELVQDCSPAGHLSSSIDIPGFSHPDGSSRFFSPNSELRAVLSGTADLRGFTITHFVTEILTLFKVF